MIIHSKRWFAAVCIATFSSFAAVAQPYPQKPVKAIVPYGVGQATDVMCRVFLDRVRVELNHPIVIENKPGAGGNIGGAEASRSPGDGYTVLCTGNATHISNPFLYESMGFDPQKDLAPVTAVAGTGYALLANNKHKGKSLAEILEMAKASPKPLTVGVASTTAHVLFGMLADATKVPLQRVPYATGNAALFTDLMRGDTDLVIEAMPSTMAPINNGQVTAIAVTNPTRTSFLPGVPTFKESGVDITLIGWNAFYAPKGTPPEVIATLNAALREVLEMPDLKKRALDLGIEAKASSPEEIGDRLKADIDKWVQVIERAGIALQ